jgi:hypothetical protein
MQPTPSRITGLARLTREALVGERIEDRADGGVLIAEANCGLCPYVLRCVNGPDEAPSVSCGRKQFQAPRIP